MRRIVARAKFFHHCPGSVLPVRDVRRGVRESHLEADAENFCANCYQSNIIRHVVENDEERLLLMTTCRHPGAGAPLGAGAKYIVGYIHITGRGTNMEGGWYVDGTAHMYRFADAIPLVWLGFKNGARTTGLDRFQLQAVLDHFAEKTDVRAECVEEIHRLDPQMRTCPHVTRGVPCPKAAACPRLRWWTTNLARL